MATFAPKSQPKVLPPTGTHIARCIELIDIGSIKGFEGRLQHKIRLSFELPDELYEFKEGEGKKPFKVSGKYTLSMHDKSTLYPIIKGIVGDIPEEVRTSFDVEELVGKECLITISHQTTKGGSEFAQIDSTSPLMKGQKALPQVNPSKILSYDNWDAKFFESLPSFMRDEMKTSVEYKKMNGEEVPTEEDYEELGDVVNPADIPF